MIDGIKIACEGLEPEIWRCNKHLEFVRPFNERTGEILPETATACYNGLKFKITPSKQKPDFEYCDIEGSLHRFHNEGGNNANDYTHQDIISDIGQLANHFHVDPDKAVIHNLEFGVNIKTPYPANQLIKWIVSTPGKRFSDLTIDKVKLGKVCARSEYQLKIYDKGRQAATGEPDLIRIEVKVKKMRYIHRKANIKTLADLREPDNIKAIQRVLLDLWHDVIIYDDNILHKTLTGREQLLIKDFKNPLYWENLNKSQRHKKQKSFKNIIYKYGINDLSKEIEGIIVDKFLYITPEQTPKFNKIPAPQRRPFHHDFQQIPAHKVATFSPLEWTVKTSPLTHSESSNNKMPENQKICPVCGRNISHQKSNSKFCSERLYGKQGKKCRNRAAQVRRTQRNHQKRILEAQNIKAALMLCGLNKMIRYTTNDRKHHRRIISALRNKPPNISKIIYVSFGGYQFTTRRAKQIMKLLI